MNEQATKTNDHQLVVVGSSAGGIEALGIMLQNMREDFPAPIVIAQHLDRNRPSYLGQILERRSRLPVVIVGERTRLEPSTVYVVPANRHVVIQDGTVHLEEDPASGPRPSVDLLLSTAAKSYGEHLIAVILTGSGSDGAMGAVEVKHAGGTVVIQNPRTAAHPSMPMALPPTVVDHVSELDTMGSLLHDLLRGLPTDELAPTKAAFASTLSYLGRHSSIDFRQYKPTTILRRIGRRMTVRHIITMEEYSEYLQTHQDEVGELVMSLLIKVTEFFRDPEAYECLRTEVFPTLLNNARDRGRVLRVWSAGCATGEEAYSLAFLIADTLGNELPEWSVKVFATDVDESAIGFARRGLYPSNLMGNLPDGYPQRFFERLDGGERIIKPLRQMVIFGQQNLNQGVPFPRIDLVACRNLLIYFKPELQQEVLDVFAYSLHHVNGYLFLGKAETARPSKAVYELVNKRWKIYRCIGGPAQLPNRAGQPPMQAEHPEPPARREGEPSDEPMVPPLDLAHFRRLNEVLLRHLPVGVLMIDRGYRILMINGAARRLLGIREMGTEQDLLHAMRGLPYADVRAAVDRVFRERTGVTLGEVQSDSLGFTEHRSLSLSLLPLVGEFGSVEMAVVSVSDATENVQLRRRLEAAQSEHRKLSEDLSSSNRRLMDLNKELQDANEELQASNEEMVLAQEELQATNEEFEATNEELQATNEELETNNEELQATNEELETTNEELVARTTELQEMTRVLSHERQRLGRLVEAAPLVLIVLRGPSLVIDSVNLPFVLFGKGKEVRGKMFAEVCPRELSKLLEGVQECYLRNVVWMSLDMQHITSDETGLAQPRTFVFTAVPDHDEQGRVDGVIVYANDVTEARAAQAQERIERLRIMIEHAEQVALAMYDATTGALLQASPRFAELLRSRSEGATETVRGSWDDLRFARDDPQAMSLQAIARDGTPKRVREMRVRLADGSESIWDCSVIPIGDPASETPYVVVAAVEITGPVQAREQLEARDRTKDEFFSIASHELRTPLTPLSVYSDILNRLMQDKERGPDWDRRVREAIGKFQNQIVHMARLTDDLLDLARLQGGGFALERRKIDLRRVLEQAVERGTADAPPVRLHVPQDKSPIPVMADEARVLQLMRNLIENAERHAPKSPAIDVRLRADRPAGRAQIEVQDYGPGIPQGDLQRLQRGGFSTLDARSTRGGLGLGLLIARALAEQHAGGLTLDSVEGKGTKATVELPLAQD